MVADDSRAPPPTNLEYAFLDAGVDACTGRRRPSRARRIGYFPDISRKALVSSAFYDIVVTNGEMFAIRNIFYKPIHKFNSLVIFSLLRFFIYVPFD